MKAIGTNRKNAILIVLIVSVGLFFLNKPCFAQDLNKEKQKKPDVKIKVNKEFDDKGNITRFDSTYSYSWSGNGQIPSNLDSLFKGFNHSFKSDRNIDSLLNQLGFSNSFNDNDFFSQPFFDQNMQFEDFFNQSPFRIDSLLSNHHNGLVGHDFDEMMKHQQQLMEQLFHRFNFNQDSLIIKYKDTIPLNRLKPKKQNFMESKSTDKTINV
jgi:hypothetical protein